MFSTDNWQLHLRQELINACVHITSYVSNCLENSLASNMLHWPFGHWLPNSPGVQQQAKVWLGLCLAWLAGKLIETSFKGYSDFY